MTIILALCIPLSFIAGGFIALKSVRMGLQWQIETKEGETPSPVVENPIKPFVEAKQEQKVENETVEVLNEWLNGEVQ